MIDMIQRNQRTAGKGEDVASYHEMLRGSDDVAAHLSPMLQQKEGGGAAVEEENVLVLNAGSGPDSWKNMMARNLGREVVVSSLVGSQNTVVTQGTLYEVGTDYVTLYHPGRRSLISTDIYAIRYIEFLPDAAQKASGKAADPGKWE